MEMQPQRGTGSTELHVEMQPERSDQLITDVLLQGIAQTWLQDNSQLN